MTRVLVALLAGLSLTSLARGQWRGLAIAVLVGLVALPVAFLVLVLWFRLVEWVRDWATVECPWCEGAPPAIAEPPACGCCGGRGRLPYQQRPQILLVLGLFAVLLGGIAAVLVLVAR